LLSDRVPSYTVRNYFPFALMKKFLRSFSVGSFAVGLTLGVVGTALSASRAGSSVFPDVPVGSYYDAAVGEMYGLGIITGFGDGSFRPNDGLTRGQAAVMMQRLRNEVLGIEPSSSSASSSSSRSRRSSSASSASTSSSSFSAPAVNEHGKFRFTTNAYSVDEDEESITISIVRTGGNTGMASVDYKVVDGTAKGDSDFEKQEGTLVFDDNDTSKSFSLTILNDTESEGDETATIQLSNVTGGAEIIDPDAATLTIVDDETASSSSAAAQEGPAQGTLQYAATMFTANENQGNSTITVERLGGTKGEVSVQYSMTDGTGKNGVNYTKTSGTLTFGDGETTKSFTLGVLDNTDIGGNKTVNLTLSSPTGGAVLDEKYMKSTLTIFDNEVGSFGSGSFRFTENDYDVLESDGYIDIPVLRQGGSLGQATVQYKTSDGSAHKGSDYEESSGTLTFRAGETTKYFRVKVLTDLVSDGGESVTLTLSSPTKATLASPSSASLMIY